MYVAFFTCEELKIIFHYRNFFLHACTFLVYVLEGWGHYCIIGKRLQKFFIFAKFLGTIRSLKQLHKQWIPLLSFVSVKHKIPCVKLLSKKASIHECMHWKSNGEFCLQSSNAETEHSYFLRFKHQNFLFFVGCAGLDSVFFWGGKENKQITIRNRTFWCWELLKAI